MENVIELKNLTHKYGDKLVLNNLNLSVKKGRIFGVLGKNGMGKTTTINILMGFLRPTSGICKVLGEDSHKISPKTRAKIGLLHEGHVAYDFMTIKQVEKFYSNFFSNWKREYYYELVNKLHLADNHRISNMSCGQRSQIVLGLIFAQDPELMILDDYSMGLDPGYRSLFIDYLKEFVSFGDKTVLMTSHIIPDMEKIIDDAIIMGHQKLLLHTSLKKFQKSFHCYQLKTSKATGVLEADNTIANIETIKSKVNIYSFKTLAQIKKYLKNKKVSMQGLKEIPLGLEEAFIGLTGKY
ncbi:MAG: ABC transporter ATP-binding protein [Candidatus Marinimicrobia bacterium]|nr:ABC transporter ATP-binding protein [Candidatus Neomarinimicrobiota bacterium]